MTINGNFKKLVRARMQQTGERYTTARQYLLAHPPQGVSAPPGQTLDWDNLPPMVIASLLPSRVTGRLPAKSQGALTAIVKVTEADYVPAGFRVRSRIDERMFTADCDVAAIQAAEVDAKVHSIALSERLMMPNV